MDGEGGRHKGGCMRTAQVSNSASTEPFSSQVILQLHTHASTYIPLAGSFTHPPSPLQADGGLVWYKSSWGSSTEVLTCTLAWHENTQVQKRKQWGPRLLNEPFYMRWRLVCTKQYIYIFIKVCNELFYLWVVVSASCVYGGKASIACIAFQWHPTLTLWYFNGVYTT